MDWIRTTGLLLLTAHLVTSRECPRLWVNQGTVLPAAVTSQRAAADAAVTSQTVRVTCWPGYTLVGSGSLRCRHGRWSSPPPACVKGGCKRLVGPDNGWIKVTHGGGLARFHCKPGYVLHGSAVLECDGKGWNSTEPWCTKDPSHRPTQHKYRKMLPPKPTHYDHKSPKLFTRQAKSDLERSDEGHSLRIKEADYSCITPGHRIAPPPKRNSLVFTKWVVSGGKPRLYAIYRCRWGFVMRGSSHTKVARMYCVNRAWKGKVGACVRKVAEKDFYARLDEVYGGGYQSDGGAPPRDHGEWLRRADYTCTGASIRAPPAVQHGNYILRDETVDGLPRMYAEYSCEAGYALAESHEKYLYCKNTEWVGNEPRCRRGGSLLCGGAGCEQRCEERAGRPVCVCRPGFRLAADGRRCNAVNECEGPAGLGYQHCTERGYRCLTAPAPDLYQCLCPSGYRIDSRTGRCEDVDECSDRTFCNHRCVNTVGSATCTCFSGFSKSDITGLCERDLPPDDSESDGDMDASDALWRVGPSSERRAHRRRGDVSRQIPPNILFNHRHRTQ